MMARTSVPGAPNENITNGSGNPARPSADFVSHLSTQAPRGSNLDRDSLKQLLQGILNTNGTQSSEGITIEDNVEENHSLISVIVDVGLDTSRNDDPFLPTTAFQIQIWDSVSVVDLVVKKTPKVLFLEHGLKSGPDTTHFVPVFAWLISKLMHVLGKQNNEETEDRVQSLLTTMVTVHTGISQSRPASASIMEFLQLCTDDLINSVEAVLGQQGSSLHNVQILFPGNSDDISAQLRKASLVSSLSDRVSIANPHRTIKVIAVLQAIVLQHICQSRKRVADPTVRRDLSLFLDSFQRLWTLFLRLQIPQSSDTQLRDLLLPLLKLLQKSRSFVLSMKHDISLGHRVALLLAQTVGDTLSSEWLGSDPKTQMSLSNPLAEILTECYSDNQLRRAFEDITMPIIRGLHFQSLSFSTEFQAVLDELNNIEVICLRGENPECHRVDRIPLLKSPVAGQNVDVEMLDAEQDRPRKRPRLSKDENEKPEMTILDSLMNRLFTKLRSKSRKSLRGLKDAISYSFENLSKEDQCETLQLMGQLACAGSGTISDCNDITVSTLVCFHCDQVGTKFNRKIIWDDPEGRFLLDAMISILPTQGFQKSREARVVAMLALKKILIHCMNHVGNLANSEYGEWCLRSLKSSVRELRIASGRTMAAFLHQGLPAHIARQNRIYALEVLQTLLSGGEIAIEETSLLALVEIAQVCGDDELNIVLIHLVEYLGHQNPYLSSLAYNQLLKLAHSVKDTTAGLLRPFWRTIGVVVVKKLQGRPQMAQQLSELIGMTISDILVLTESHILPFLVLTKNVDIVRRIASAHDPPVSTKHLLIQDDNFPPVLALLLMQPSPEPNQMILSHLTTISADFVEPLHKLLDKNTIRIACEILKAAGDVQEGKGSRAHQGLRLLSCITSSGSSRKSDSLGIFFETNVLGMIKEFAETINEGQIRQPLTEKRRCLKAVAAMVKLGKSHIASALPQISACLRSAIEGDELCDSAFQAWSTMIFSLSQEEIEPLIDQTFSMVARHWNSFPQEMQALAQVTVDHIFSEHSGALELNADILPSLGSVPELQRYEETIQSLKNGYDTRHRLLFFIKRCQSDNVTGVLQALTELTSYLEDTQDFLHQPSINEIPDPIVPQLTRAVLDACVKFSPDVSEVALICAKCLGLIGCLDPNRVEATRVKKEMLVLSNFTQADETIEFILFFMQEVLVNAFLSAPTTRAQGFLAYAMQELLLLCDFDSSVFYPSDADMNVNYKRWLDLPELTRNTLTPFLTSRYTLKKGNVNNKCSYPLFHAQMTHYDWIQRIVLDLLQKNNDEDVKLLFDICTRIIRYQDISIPTFLLRFTVLNLVIGGTEQEKNELKREFMSILQYELPEDRRVRNHILSCSESIFETLDYMSRWRQENSRQLYNARVSMAHGRYHTDLNLENYAASIASVEDVLDSIPADVISRRAVECKSYARALLHWEQFIRQQEANAGGRDDPRDLDPYFERLQEIYSQIDEPDGIEGISAQLQVPNIEQQIFEHQKAGRWTAAQSWYEIRLNENPDNSETQLNLLKCMKESGQYDGIMNQIDRINYEGAGPAKLLPFGVEAAWITARWDKLKQYTKQWDIPGVGDFNIRVGSSLLALYERDPEAASKILQDTRHELGKGLTFSSTSSLQSCHDTLIKLHVLEDMETLMKPVEEHPRDRRDLFLGLDRRLQVVGGYVGDKQHLLGLRRAVMQLSPDFTVDEIAKTWIDSAILARKSNAPNQAMNSVLHASRLGSADAIIENARLLWAEGHHQKAVKMLDGFLETRSFAVSELNSFAETDDKSMTQNQYQKARAAEAQLLLAKWLDRAGQTQQTQIQGRYRNAISLRRKWEKGHFALGKFYNKLLDSEALKPSNKRSETCLSGEMAKLAIDNYLRSMPYGFKYVFRTLPKILTLWLDLASSGDQPTDLRNLTDESLKVSVIDRRKKVLDQINAQVKKYLDKAPVCSFYTGLPQIVARICHPSLSVQGVLTSMIVKIISHYPQQALWTLLAVCKSSSWDRSTKGADCLRKVQENARRTKSGPVDVKQLVTSGRKLTDELLRICEMDVQGKPSKISLSRDLRFNNTLVPCKLVVPVEETLTPSLPPNVEQSKISTHSAFPQDTITISGFFDDVLVLSSLQKPRKLNLRGSDGKLYGLLCKPKDDLRKDQRLMEFNTMINRFLKRDDETSKRKLYIKTYAVTPLNEECGLIQWVDNLKTLRDILLRMYKERNVSINYNEIRALLDEACLDRSKLHVFTDKLLGHFRPIFYEWFIDMFPEPDQWFAARLRYTRSCAVMSMVGHVLGLGDRHGENILFQEDSGGTLHVDFNCLFDKGLTFEKPELVPFRLTHNMVNAFGVYGCDGPFRRCCELTMALLRQNEDALMTVLETFVYDPTTDFIGGHHPHGQHHRNAAKKRARTHAAGVPDSPLGVLENVRAKLRGLLTGESVPLSVGGQVDHLIREATSPTNLARMYIGWCAFL